VISGFNTDIVYDDVTYHVQTEDKGLESRLVLSLVYVGGAIIASKRTSYDEIFPQPQSYSELVLVERVNKQHKLICAAIKAGRIDDLKKMGSKAASAATEARSAPAEEIRPPEPPPIPQIEEPEELPQPPEEVPAEPVLSIPLYTEEVTEPIAENVIEPEASEAVLDLPEIPQPVEKPKEPKDLRESIRLSRLNALKRAMLGNKSQENKEEKSADELTLTLLREKEFHAGETVVLRIRVGRGERGKIAVPSANVVVKILGSSFRPVFLATKTGRDGIAVIRATLPAFGVGRAALLIYTEHNGQRAELRRIILKS
jgi:hypothetical protein